MNGIGIGWRSAVLIVAAIPFVSLRTAAGQAVEIQFTDTSGRSIQEAVVEVLTHTSTTPVVVDTVRSQTGWTRVRVPPPQTSEKLYVIKLCAKGYAPQFVTAPFSRFDTLRLAARLARLQLDSTRDREPCAGAPGSPARVTVTDTSTFVGLAAATNIETSALAYTHGNLLKARMHRDTIEARTYRGRIVAQLKHRIASARSASERARAAHTLISFAWWTHTGLDAKTRTSVNSALAPDSRWWITDPYLIGFWGTQLFCSSSGTRDPSEIARNVRVRRCMQNVLERMANSIDEPEIRSEAQSQLIRLAYMSADTSRGQSILEQMLAETPNYPFTQFVASDFAPNRPLRVGAMMPSFSFAALPDTTRRITNATIAGKFTLIDFWGTWCAPCVGAMPELHRVYEAYHARGFEILSVAADEAPEPVLGFQRTKWPMPWLNAFAEYVEAAKENPKLRELGIVAFPRALLLDPQGKIVGEFGFGVEELASTLDRSLGH